MIIIPKTELKFLKAGRPITVITINPGRYRKGRTYALGIVHNRTICRVEILERGDETIRVRIVRVDQPRFLAARSEYGYTYNQSQAMNSEPEPVYPEDQERISKDAEASGWDSRKLRSIGIRLKEAAKREDWAAAALLREELGAFPSDLGPFGLRVDGGSATP